MNNLKSLLIIVTVSLLLISCNLLENYQGSDEPKFEGDYADGLPEFEGQLKVVTWNIKFSEKIEATILELSEVEALQGADIILLQEMDEVGVDAIAKALQYNYVYFPASIHSHHNKNFGNAILSKWPLSDGKKLILPHKNPKNDQIRTATRALVMVGDLEIPTYSVHTETVWLSGSKRDDQISFLAEDIGSDQDFIIIGGDFNTVTPQSIDNLDQRFQEVGLTRVSEGAGHTFERGGLPFAMDHIYAKGLQALDNGVWLDTEASDHFPVWADLLVDR